LQWERFVRDPTGNNPDNIAELDLVKMPVELRYYDPSGVFTFLRTTFVRESGRFRNFDLEIEEGDDTFTVVDAGVGWRIPGRAAIGSLEIKNLFDTKFRFQDTDPTNPVIVPNRFVVGRVTLNF
jgi:outer membrane receptor protein involved in Fe transport